MVKSPDRTRKLEAEVARLSGKLEDARKLIVHLDNGAAVVNCRRVLQVVRAERDDLEARAVRAEEALDYIRAMGGRGPELVDRVLAAVDASLAERPARTCCGCAGKLTVEIRGEVVACPVCQLVSNRA